MWNKEREFEDFLNRHKTEVKEWMKRKLNDFRHRTRPSGDFDGNNF